MSIAVGSSFLRGLAGRLRDVFPEGRRLPDDVWRRRHRGVLILLWLHAIGITTFGLARGYAVDHTLLEAGVVALAALLAGWLPGPRRLRSVIACFGLMTAAALLVHFSGGYIEFHFHFFVMVGLLALYQDWTTFLLAIGYVVVHHGLVGVLDPTSVYNHPAAWTNPWLWAGIHGGFILAMSLVSLVTWRVNERAHELTQVVLDSAGEGIVGVDAQGRATFVNAAAARMLERSVEEMIGQPLGPLVLDPPDPASAPCRLYASLGTDAAVEDVFRTRDGRRVPVEYVSTELRARGTLTGAVVVFKDVSRRQAEQEALRQSEAQLRQAQKMEAVGLLAGGIAHDFNNLLSIIIGRGELLRERIRSAAHQEAVELITITAKRAATLTAQLLAFSRQQVLQPQVFDLVEVVASMATMLRRLIGEHIELKTVAARKPALVRADIAQIQQVILNLVVNARDAMPRGGLLTIEVTDAGGAEPAIMLAVRDNGCGIDEAVQARMFEPFFTTKPAGVGSGLGLATVYGIVKQHGGTIAVESAPGQGATFRVCLPRVEGPVVAVDDRTPSQRAFGNETIMLVEDDADVRALARDILRSHRYTVIEAGSGEEALRLAAATTAPIHLLLTDVIMKGMDGPQLAGCLQAARPGLSVLFMSGYPGDTIARRGTLDERAALLPKPFTVKQLTSAVRDALDRVAVV